VEPHDGASDRAAQRSNWPVRHYALGEEPADACADTTAGDRIAMMWPLALEAWKLAGLSIPEAPIGDLPSRIVRVPKG
jgi:hypothetical protein